jgi:hypothetical protein
MSVKFVKLVSGDELVTEVQDNGDSVVLTKAAKISSLFEFADPPPTPKTRVDVFAPHSQGLRFKISKQHIIFIEDPHPTLLEYYNSSFLPGLPKE